MLSEPRTISLLCEVVHIPLKHTSEALREVFHRVSTPCGYENFIRTGSGARMERKGVESGGFTQVNFTEDRVQFTDDHAGVSVEQFAHKVFVVLTEACSCLRIPIFLFQQATVRATAAPNSHRSAAEFLARRMFRIRGEDIEAIGRPASVFGFRLVFPATASEQHSYNARIESYTRDPRSLYIENVGTFSNPFQPNALQQVEANIQETSRFLVDRLLPFLSAYDRRDAAADP